MNPTIENPAPATGYCRECGKALSGDEIHLVHGVIYCADHAPPAERPVGGPPSHTPGALDAGTSPALAFFLGFIPGVGAIYNGQYAKGLVHVIIFGFLVSILSSGASAGLEPLFGLLTTMFVFYMAFEAYHTTKRRLAGQPVDEFSSLFPRRESANSYLAPVLLIVLGVLFLLNNLGVFELYHMVRYWPVLLILLGVLMLVERIRASRGSSAAADSVEPGRGGRA